jgi:hypothetical protein
MQELTTYQRNCIEFANTNDIDRMRSDMNTNSEYSDDDYSDGEDDCKDELGTAERYDNIVPTTPLHTVLMMGVGHITVAFHERDNVPPFNVDTGDVKVFKSNYDFKIQPGYSYVPKKKSKKKPRRTMGNGTCMNSSISFIIPTDTNNCGYYDISIYRTGKYQICGIVNDDLVDIREKFATLIKYLGSYFTNIVEEKALDIILSNTRFVTYEGKSLVLTRVYALLQRKTFASLSDIPFFVHNWTEGASLMYVKFKTPLKHKPSKKICASISSKGKVNIQGGVVGYDYVDRIYKFLTNVLSYKYLYEDMPPEAPSPKKGCKRNNQKKHTELIRQYDLALKTAVVRCELAIGNMNKLLASVQSRSLARDSYIKFDDMARSAIANPATKKPP